MAPRISIIIPVLNEAARIGAVLTCLRDRFPDAELLVVDGGSDDETVRSAMRHCDRLLLGERGRARQMNLGGRASAGEYLLFLHADTLPEFSQQYLSGALADGPAWGFCPVRLDGSRRAFRVIEWFINRRSRLTRIATGDQMLFLRRDVFEHCGGYEPLPLMEDVALCKRLRGEAPPRVLDRPVVTSSRRWEEGGVVRTVLLMWSLRLAYFLGASPQRLVRHYRGH